MSKVKILVVEDEILIADDICQTLEDLGYEVMEPVSNYTEALEALENELPDLAMLDIQLDGQKDGIDLAWKIKEDFDIPFIFLTSNADAETIARAKKVAPPAYLIKPFNRYDLFASIEIALNNYNLYKEERKASEQEDLVIKGAIFVKQKDVFHKVKFAELAYIKSDHVYLELYTVNAKKFVIRSTIKSLAEKLPANFFQTNRSHMVNLDHLDSIDVSHVVISGQNVPIGKNYRNELIDKISTE